MRKYTKRTHKYAIRSDSITIKIEDKVIPLLKETSKSCREIGEIFNCSRTIINDIKLKNNITRPDNPRRVHFKQPCKWCGNAFYPTGKCKTRPNRGKFCKRECYNKWQQSEDNRGQNNPAWKDGGIHETEQQSLRHTPEWREWRTAVFKRDNYTCQICEQRGVLLHPHHIKMRMYFPELTFDVDNGITLCVDCHRKEPVHGEDYDYMYAFQEMVQYYNARTNGWKT